MEEKPNFGKGVLLAALVGGCAGLLGQILVSLYSFTPLYGQGLTTIFVLATFVLIGAVLFLTGIYPKLEKIGGMGAVLPLCGLASAIAGATFGVGKATKSYGKGALTPIIELLVKIVLVGTELCCIIAVVSNFIGFDASVTAPYAPGGIVVTNVGMPNGTEAGPPMGIPVSIAPLTFVWAFVVGAVVAIIFHIIFVLTKINMSIYLVILLTLGGLLTPFGIMKDVVLFGGGGFQVMIIDAGEAIFCTFYALLQGNFLPFIEVLILFAYIFIVGIIAGWIKLAMSKGDGGPEGAPEAAPAEH
ncbi:MAG: SpoVA/SpoVAEb family sporulation membrane protein [Eggerthellaceae bacterium]|nr:SpoVA/SpoVAEb family sporulation membrane protein [Eggerthellaceae bacterium]